MFNGSQLISALAMLTLLLSAFPARAATGPAPITGTWTGEFKGENEVQLNLQMKGQSGWSGQSLSLSSLRGLTRQQGANGASVRFELVRDAGTVAFEGAFKDEKGSGAFTFTPSGAFVDDMAALGFRGLSPEQLLTMEMVDVSRGYAREMKALGYDQLSTNQLISMRIFQVTPDFVNAFRSLGYDRLQPDQLVNLRIFKVTPDFIRELEARGYEHLPVNELTNLRIFKVTPGFIDDLRSLGYERLPVSQLVNLRIFHVSPDLIRDLQKQGFRRLSADDLVHYRIFGSLLGSAGRQ
jgi:hypothetical protein